MPQIRGDLSLSNTGFGLVVNSFLLLYTVFYVVGGRVADRFGVRRSFYLMAVLWSLACMLHSLVQGFVSLCLVRALLGTGQGGYYPTAYRGISEWFKPSQRSKPAGVLTSGASIGALIAAPIVSWLTIRSGWRLAFLIIGAGCLVLVPLWLILGQRVNQAYGKANPSPAFALEDGPSVSAQINISLRDAIKSRKFICLLMARGITDVVWYFYVFWMSGYFQSVRGFSLAMVGRFLWIPYFAATVGALASGWINNVLISQGVPLNTSRKLGLTISGIICLAVVLVNYAPNSMDAVALLSLALFGHMAWITYILTIITEVSPPQHVATMFGITGAAGTILGGLSQPLVGLTVDVIGYNPLFICCGGAFLVALILIAGMGKIEPIGRSKGLT
jgi:MFS transporter, ACS family, hexuronate transporter